MWSLLVSSALFASSVTASLQIIPGGTWTAKNTGEHVQAHGGAIYKEGNTFYWIGENKKDGSPFQSINCYSSTNLVEWNFVNSLLTRQGSGDLGPSRVVERPKVLKNPSTGQYVMYLHIDDSSYKEAKVGVATSSSICGGYNYRGSFQPLGFQSRDIGLYQDDDGTGYLLTEDRVNGLRIDRLSRDYLSVESNVYLWSKLRYESQAIVKVNGVYFHFASQQSGWDTNDNKYCTATSLSGPWSSWQNFAPSGSKTLNSQVTYVLPLGGNRFMYMGDRWVPGNLASSTYVWVPLTISGTSASMTNKVNWIYDPNSGTTRDGPAENAYEGESAQLSNGAKSVNCDGCSGSKSAGYVGGSSNGAIQFNNVAVDQSGITSIRVKYTNGDKAPRFASVVVNGVGQTLAFQGTTDGNSPWSSTLNVNLNAGSGNTIKFSGINSQWGPDIDKIFVPKN